MDELSVTKRQRLLISFLGTGNYKKVKYQLNGQEKESELSIIPIVDFFQPDKIYVIGTKDSRWELIEGLSYERLEIPAGKSGDEFWKMFDLLAQNIAIQEADIAFDITHCFRSIPFFVVILIQFIKFLEKSAEIRHIFYGYLDQKTEDSHIIDLRPLMELLDWMEALASFRKYGDLDDLCRLVERAEKDIRQQGGTESRLRNLKKDLRELNAITKMTYVPQLGEISETLSGLLADPSLSHETEEYLKPLHILLPELRKMIKRFKRKTEWEAQLETARWYLENKNPSQALLVLRETIVTFICDKEKLDPYDKKVREQIEKKLNEERMFSHEPIIKFWNEVIDPRNNVAHVLMKRQDKNIDPKAAMRKVHSLINKAEVILNQEPDNAN